MSIQYVDTEKQHAIDKTDEAEDGEVEGFKEAVIEQTIRLLDLPFEDAKYDETDAASHKCADDRPRAPCVSRASPGQANDNFDCQSWYMQSLGYNSREAKEPAKSRIPR